VAAARPRRLNATIFCGTALMPAWRGACGGVYAEATTRFESDAQLWCGWAAVEAN